jgi:hypothetical protein
LSKKQEIEFLFPFVSGVLPPSEKSREQLEKSIFFVLRSAKDAGVLKFALWF